MASQTKREEEIRMEKNKWESKRMHEHPAKHRAGTWGTICLSEAGVYYLKVGASIVSCPQEWAAQIQVQEDTLEETSYILRGIPADVWKEAKKKAIDQGKNMKDVLLQFLEEWIRKESD